MKNPTALLLACLAVACQASEPQDEGPYLPPLEPPVELLADLEPWTEAFLAERVLVADLIRVRGPLHLIDHVAVRQDPETMEMAVEGRGSELRHTYRSRGGAAEIRAQLDGWTLVAANELLVIQDAQLTDLSVEAQGGVALVDVANGERSTSEDYARTEPLARPSFAAEATSGSAEQRAGQPASAAGGE